MAYDLKDASKLTVHTLLKMEKGAVGALAPQQYTQGDFLQMNLNNMYVILHGVVPFSVDCIALAWH